MLNKSNEFFFAFFPQGEANEGIFYRVPFSYFSHENKGCMGARVLRGEEGNYEGIGMSCIVGIEIK